MNKLWAGRSEAETSALADAFNSSIAVDGRMFKQDITGSMAHAAMLAKCGILTQADADAIIDGLPFWQIWTAASWNLIPTRRTFTCSSRQNSRNASAM